MGYEAELDYLMRVLQKLNLQALILSPENAPRQRVDLGLRKFLGLEGLYQQAVRLVPGLLRHNAIFRLTDEFFCHYIFFLLPDSRDSHFIIGPYLSSPVSRERLLEQVEHYSVSARQFSRFFTCFADIPVMADDSALFAMLSTFGESLWGKGNAFEFVDFNFQPSARPAGRPAPANDAPADPEELALQMQAMEKRYGFENQLMDYVSQGLVSRAEHILLHFPGIGSAPHMADPIRSIRNYCVICNTLLRKAAEKGGVHPLQLDHHSRELARKAEQVNEVSDGMALMRTMIHTYCRLVRKQAIGHFPPLVQRTLSYMDANLAGDLRLSTLATAHNVSSTYLSALFRREYGKTITECILEKRMDAACHLLLTTHLQIQTIAQHCGFSDVNYFSKVFKKTYGLTPRQFRDQRLMPMGL